MSENWKNDSAEASMREGTESIRKAAEEKAKQEDNKSITNIWSIAINARGKGSDEAMANFLKDFIKLRDEHTSDIVTINIEEIQ